MDAERIDELKRNDGAAIIHTVCGCDLVTTFLRRQTFDVACPATDVERVRPLWGCRKRMATDRRTNLNLNSPSTRRNSHRPNGPV